MLEMVEARKDADKVEERYDLFSGLLDATQDETGSEAALSDDEFMGSYPTSGSLGREKSHPSSQETCFFFFLLDMRWGRFRLPPILPYTIFYRLQRIHCASRLPSWLWILANKNVYINT